MAKKKEGSNEAYRTTAEELRWFVEQIENLQGDAKAIAEDIKDKFSEAKGQGYDTKALRLIIAERKKNPEDVQEFEAICELYRTALGMSHPDGPFTTVGEGPEEPDADAESMV